MDLKAKLVELLDEAEEWADHKCDELDCETCPADKMKGNCVQQLMVDRLIAHGVTVQEWISASKPPKERGRYLISVKHWLGGKPVTREAFWNGADWLSCYWKKGDRVELTPRVTHWQYLPQPPKGEDTP